jgi:nucleoid-associated protein YgaU
MMALEKENANLRIDNDYLRNELRDVRDRLDAMGNVRIPAGKIPSNEAAVVAPAPIAAPIEAPAPETPAKLRSVSASATQTTAVLRLNAPPTSAPLAIAPPPATAATARATATVSVRESARRTRIYQVQTGDTLMKISVKMYGTSRRWRDIYNSNHTAMRNDRDLRVGQTLSIPP